MISSLPSMSDSSSRSLGVAQHPFVLDDYGAVSHAFEDPIARHAFGRRANVSHG
jgi:hypothetical protein